MRVHHRPGEANVVDNALTRAHIRTARVIGTRTGSDAQQLQTLMSTDGEIREGQLLSDLNSKREASKPYREKPIVNVQGLVIIRTPAGLSTVLSPTVWSVVLSKCHDSIETGHLRFKHTFEKVSKMY